MSEIDFNFWIAFITGFFCGIGFVFSVYTYIDTKKRYKK